jgi:hypothetical protein
MRAGSTILAVHPTPSTSIPHIHPCNGLWPHSSLPEFCRKASPLAAKLGTATCPKRTPWDEMDVELVAWGGEGGQELWPMSRPDPAASWPDHCEPWPCTPYAPCQPPSHATHVAPCHLLRSGHPWPCSPYYPNPGDPCYSNRHLTNAPCPLTISCHTTLVSQGCLACNR